MPPPFERAKRVPGVDMYFGPRQGQDVAGRTLHVRSSSNAFGSDIERAVRIASDDQPARRIAPSAQRRKEGGALNEQPGGEGIAVGRGGADDRGQQRPLRGPAGPRIEHVAVASVVVRERLAERRRNGERSIEQA